LYSLEYSWHISIFA